MNTRLLGFLVLSGLTLIVYGGVKYVARFAVAFLAGVSLAVCAIYAGVAVNSAGAGKEGKGVMGLSLSRLRENLHSDYKKEYGVDWRSAAWVPRRARRRRAS